MGFDKYFLNDKILKPIFENFIKKITIVTIKLKITWVEWKN